MAFLDNLPCCAKLCVQLHLTGQACRSVVRGEHILRAMLIRTRYELGTGKVLARTESLGSEVPKSVDKISRLSH